jgi:hypothetical protein
LLPASGLASVDKHDIGHAHRIEHLAARPGRVEPDVAFQLFLER